MHNSRRPRVSESDSASLHAQAQPRIRKRGGVDTRRLGAGILSAAAVGGVAAPAAKANFYSVFWGNHGPAYIGPGDSVSGLTDYVPLSYAQASQYNRVGCASLEKSFHRYTNCHNPGTVDWVSFPPPEHKPKWAYCRNQGSKYSNAMVCANGWS